MLHVSISSTTYYQSSISLSGLDITLISISLYNNLLLYNE